MRKKRKFDKDFKLSVIGELQTKTASEVCREKNLCPSLIQRWKNEYKTNPVKAFSGNGNLWKKEAEIEKYKRLVGQLYAENEFLKKTIGHLQSLQEKEIRMRYIK
jgi:transposase-like protein